MLPVILFSQFIGFLAIAALALVQREQLITPSDMLWGAAAGLIGAAGLVALYRALAIGQMSIAAPITAVLGAGIPVILTVVTVGLPKASQVIGFGLALAGIWLMSRSENHTTANTAAAQPSQSPAFLANGIGLALVGGLFFGLFFTFMGQFSENAVFLPLVIARCASIPLFFILAISRKQLQLPPRNVLGIVVLAGIMDAGGNVGFVLAEQAGRLDIATVLSSLYPAMTALLAILILKERLNRWQTLGMALILAAIVLIAAAL